jgi:3-deoxy-D-manno-octulosonate 8-phosphate phosphatase (KDO 8-P phosphatase)
MVKIFNRDKLLKNMELVVFDFDGVFTDNKVHITENGMESVSCFRSDGLGLDLLRKLNINMAILSGEKNGIVQTRAKKLCLECYHGVEEKKIVLQSIIDQYGVDYSKVAFVGNDINDLSCLRLVGLPVAVNDAYPQVKKVARIVLKRKGGMGAVREFCEMLVKAKEDGKNRA